MKLMNLNQDHLSIPEMMDYASMIWMPSGKFTHMVRNVSTYPSSASLTSSPAPRKPSSSLVPETSKHINN